VVSGVMVVVWVKVNVNEILKRTEFFRWEKANQYKKIEFESNYVRA